MLFKNFATCFRYLHKEMRPSACLVAKVLAAQLHARPETITAPSSHLVPAFGTTH